MSSDNSDAVKCSNGSSNEAAVVTAATTTPDTTAATDTAAGVAPENPKPPDAAPRKKRRASSDDIIVPMEVSSTTSTLKRRASTSDLFASDLVAIEECQRPSGTFWGNLARSTDLWQYEQDGSHELDNDDNEYTSPLPSANSIPRTLKRHLSDLFRLLCSGFTDVRLLVVFCVVFGLLTAISLYAVLGSAAAFENSRRKEIAETTQEIGYYISHELANAMLPLFTLSQFVQHLEIFKRLSQQIKQRGEPGAAPPLTGNELSYRNVTGICDDPTLIREFDTIAQSIKKDAKMNHVLVNLQLAPVGVVCMLHPLINKNDFGDGIVMNSTVVIGMDQLYDPQRMAIARATVQSQHIVVAGPLHLVQGEMTPVPEAFIARQAIRLPNNTITLNGVDYPCWGFATLLLNWANFKEQIDLYGLFERHDIEFILTRTDVFFDAKTQTFYEEVVVITQSKLASQQIHPIKVPLNITNNKWELQVTYTTGFSPPWKLSLSIAVTLASLLLSLTLMTILTIKNQQRHLLYRMMPPKVIQQLQNNETVIEKYNNATIFFSDIVAFTTLQGRQMHPAQVMNLLNQLYTEFDKLVIKHEVQKVEAVGNVYIVVGAGQQQQQQSNPLQQHPLDEDENSITESASSEKVAMFALEVIHYVQHFKRIDGINVEIRVGIATGPAVGGVVGKTVPKYTLFGDTVQLAYDMEVSSKQMRIQCCDCTRRLLEMARGYVFECEERDDWSDDDIGAGSGGDTSGDNVCTGHCGNGNCSNRGGDGSNQNERRNGPKGVFIKGRGWTPTWWIKGSSKVG